MSPHSWQPYRLAVADVVGDLRPDLPPVLVPLTAAQLLAVVQRLYRELQLASEAERPFLEREIRVYADRYRACCLEDVTPCST